MWWGGVGANYGRTGIFSFFFVVKLPHENLLKSPRNCLLASTVRLELLIDWRSTHLHRMKYNLGIWEFGDMYVNTRFDI